MNEPFHPASVNSYTFGTCQGPQIQLDGACYTGIPRRCIEFLPVINSAREARLGLSDKIIRSKLTLDQKVDLIRAMKLDALD